MCHHKNMQPCINTWMDPRVCRVWLGLHPILGHEVQKYFKTFVSYGVTLVSPVFLLCNTLLTILKYPRLVPAHTTG